MVVLLAVLERRQEVVGVVSAWWCECFTDFSGHYWPLQDMCGVCGVTGPLAGLVLADLPCQVQRQLQPLLLPHSFYLDNLNWAGPGYPQQKLQQRIKTIRGSRRTMGWLRPAELMVFTPNKSQVLGGSHWQQVGGVTGPQTSGQSIGRPSWSLPRSELEWGGRSWCQHSFSQYRQGPDQR